MINGIYVDRQGLPVVVYKPQFIDHNRIYEAVVKGYIKYCGEEPSNEEKVGWKRSIPVVLEAAREYPVIIEYPILGGLERVDYIIVGKEKALIVEAKVWRGECRRISDYTVRVDSDEVRIDPCYQLKNYIAKFKHLHTAGLKLEFDGLVLAIDFNYIDGCNIVKKEGFLEAVSRLGEPGGLNEVDLIINGRFHISPSLVDFVKKNKERLMKQAVNTLLGAGYGLTEEQLRIVNDVLRALDDKDCRKAFIVKGVSGSGKTLVALTLFFEALGRGYRVLLTYRNNRLLNTLRVVLGGSLAGLIKFYSTGPQGRYRGVAEKNFPQRRYRDLDLVIYDEAQRMTYDNILVSLERSRIKVYLFDDEQILIGDEEGTEGNFIKASKKVGYTYYELPRPARIPLNYLKAIRNLLTKGDFKPEFTGIDFVIYNDIVSMLHELRLKREGGYRVALVASFTETPGNRNNRRAPDNLRIGYPLCRKYDERKGSCIEQSDLDIYRGRGLEIYWLMDEKEEYPRYWMGELDPLKYCASVYGSQGFEADYVGVIWGRDLVWRKSGWSVNPDPITDYVGDEYSLKEIAKSNRKRAYELLVNRYIILLTRATKGVYVFFEDEETREFVSKQLGRPEA